MKDLRDDPWTTVAGITISGREDYWDESGERGKITSATEREARNILVFSFDGGQLTLRPSGTEPKLKFYVQTERGSGKLGAQAWADQISEWVYNDILRLLGHELAREFASLPDVIPLDSKLEMEHVVVPQLRQLLVEEGREPSYASDWFKEKVRALVPGASAALIAAQVLRTTSRVWDPAEVERLEPVLVLLERQQP